MLSEHTNPLAGSQGKGKDTLFQCIFHKFEIKDSLCFSYKCCYSLIIHSHNLRMLYQKSELIFNITICFIISLIDKNGPEAQNGFLKKKNFLMYHKYKNSQNVVIVNGDQKLRYRMCICMLWFEVICKWDNFLYTA